MPGIAADPSKILMPVAALVGLDSLPVPKRVTSVGLSQVYALRDCAFHLAYKVLADSTIPVIDQCSALGACVKAWSVADDRIRIYRNKPPLAAIKLDKRPKRGNGAATMLDSTPGRHVLDKSAVVPDSPSANETKPNSGATAPKPKLD